MPAAIVTQQRQTAAVVTPQAISIAKVYPQSVTGDNQVIGTTGGTGAATNVYIHTPIQATPTAVTRRTSSSKSVSLIILIIQIFKKILIVCYSN